MYLTRDQLRRMAGEVLICGFDGQDVGPELKEILRETKPLGLILFARNLSVPEANIELCRRLKSLRANPEHPLMLSVDQEGGRVARLKEGMTRWPPMARLGAWHRYDPRGARHAATAVGEALAREVRAIGFDLDYAPVLDVHTNPNNPVIGDRALSTDPEAVAELGAAWVRGMQGAGVGACGKHFPGHGDTDTDSHLTLPKISHDLRRLEAVEWRPFRAAIEAGVSSLMTAHVLMEACDGTIATLSELLLTTHLRERMGYRGIILSDDVDMRALADHYAMTEVGRLGMRAGVDVFLACRDPEAIMQLYRGIVLAAESGALPHATLYEHAQRAVAWRRAYKPALGSGQAMQALAQAVDAHRGLADQLAGFSGPHA
jgi:beta-N-acetylhexosaminidase